MNEILSGAKVLKLYGWEKSFIGQVMGIRLGEIKASNLYQDLCDHFGNFLLNWYET